MLNLTQTGMGTRKYNKSLVFNKKKDPCPYYLIFVEGVPVNSRNDSGANSFCTIVYKYIYILECIKNML